MALKVSRREFPTLDEKGGGKKGRKVYCHQEQMKVVPFVVVGLDGYHLYRL